MTPLTSQDLEALKALAEKATPGRWLGDWCAYGTLEQMSGFSGPLYPVSDSRCTSAPDLSDGVCIGVFKSTEDAKFAAAFNPQTALALLTHVKALEAEKAEARRLALEEAAAKIPDLANGARFYEANAEGDAARSAGRVVAAFERAEEAVLALKERT